MLPLPSTRSIDNLSENHEDTCIIPAQQVELRRLPI